MPEARSEVWTVFLGSSGEPSPDDVGLLDEPERDRRSRLRKADGRRAFAVCRAVVRRLVAASVGVRAEEVSLEFGGLGKPRVSGPSPAVHLRFNVSHSQEWAMIALSDGLEVGVDLEWKDPDVARETGVGPFSPHEAAGMAAHEGASFVESFFRCWTAKEAYVKAAGTGLAMPLDGFDVCPSVGAEPRVVRQYCGPLHAGPLFLTKVQAPYGYAASLCSPLDGVEVCAKLWGAGGPFGEEGDPRVSGVGMSAMRSRPAS